MPDDTNPSLDVTARLDASSLVFGAGTAKEAIAGVTTATSQASEVAKTYSISVSQAERALELFQVSAGKAAVSVEELDAAYELFRTETIRGAEAQAAYNAELAASAAEIAAAGDAQATLGVVTAKTARALAALSIEQTAVAETATEMGLSMEVAALAMIKIERTQLASTVKDASLAMQGLTDATVENTVATEAEAEATALDAEALAARAIMMRRTSDGLVDLAMGGRRAIQGVTDLQFVLTKMFPGGAVTIGVLGGLALIGEIWEHIADKMAKDHEKATAKIKTNIDEMVKETETRFIPVLERQLDLQKQIQQIQKDELTDIANTASAKERGLDLDRQIAVQQAKQRELAALGNTKDEGEKKRIEARFNAEVSDINSKGEVDSATAELEAKQAEIDATKKDLAQQQGAIADLRNQIAAITSQRTTDAQFMAAHGITTDKDGVLIHKKTDARGKDISTPALADLQAKAQEATQDFVDVANNPNNLAQHNPKVFERFRSNAKEATNNYEQAQQIQNRALTTDSDKSVTDMQKHVDELSGTIAKTSDSLDKLGPALENLNKGVELANLKSVTSAVESNQNSADVNAKYPAKPTDLSSVNGALNLALGEAGANTGRNSGDQLRQIGEVTTHIRDAAKAGQDISGFVLQLIQEMEQFKIGSQKDRDKIMDALTAFKQSSKTNALQ